MYKSLFLIAGLAAISSTQAAQISCGAPISTGTLWYSNATHRSYIGQLGILEAYGNAELLAKYPGSNVVAHTVNVIPCNSTALNATIPAAGSWKDTPVILQLADDTSNCLSLEAGSKRDNTFITKQSCFYSDDSSQFVQFWTRAFKHHTLFPTWEPKASERWNIQFNTGDTSEVLAQPANCTGSCQYAQEYSLAIKK